MQALARGWATTVVTACAKGIAWSVWRWWMVWCSSKWWHMQHPMEKSFPTTISLSGGDRSFGDDLFESRYCKCWEYPLWYDSLRFILCFSVCCPLLSAFLINLCYWQFLANLQSSTQTWIEEVFLRIFNLQSSIRYILQLIAINCKF